MIVFCNVEYDGDGTEAIVLCEFDLVSLIWQKNTRNGGVFDVSLIIMVLFSGN